MGRKGAKGGGGRPWNDIWAAVPKAQWTGKENERMRAREELGGRKEGGERMDGTAGIVSIARPSTRKGTGQ